MKSFKQFHEANISRNDAEPKSPDEKRFKDKHVVQKTGHPAAKDDQFVAKTKKDTSKPAGYHEGEDEKVYESVNEEMVKPSNTANPAAHKKAAAYHIGQANNHKEALKKPGMETSYYNDHRAAHKAHMTAADSHTGAMKVHKTAGAGDNRIMDRTNMANKKSAAAKSASQTAMSESTIDEVLDTPKAMQSYLSKAKASKEKAASSAAKKVLRGPDKDGFRLHPAKELKTMAKRTAGERMANKKVREEAELDEAKEPSMAKIHAILNPTKNSAQGIQALMKSLKVDRKTAEKYMNKAMDSMMGKKSVSELNVSTLGNYIRKSAADAAKPGASARQQDKRIGGQSMADKKIRKAGGYSSSAKVGAQNEEAEVSYDVAKKRLQRMKKGSQVSFTHATTGKKVTGEYKGLRNMGGRSYAHVEHGDGATRVPVHQIHQVQK